MTDEDGNTKPPLAGLAAPRGLVVEELSVSYRLPGRPAQPALDQLSLRLEPGEALGVLGASGSGKSTLALALAGLLPTAASLSARRLTLGEEQLLGRDERAWRRLRGAEIGCVFQQPFLALCPWRRVGEQLADVVAAHLPLRRREARDRAHALLAEFGLESALAAAFPHQLSGGQRQRVVFCQAIAAGPRLLIADEPTASLDPAAAAQLLAWVAQLRARRGLALIFISHDPEVLARVADRLLVLEAGCKVEEGPAARLFAAPTAAATRLLLAAAAPPAPPPELPSEPAPALAAPPPFLARATSAVVELGRGRFWQRRHRRHQLLAAADFELREGEVVGLFGASGSGKSTLLRCLAGLQKLSAGRLEIAGVDLVAASPARQRELRRQIQLVGQDPASLVDPRWPLWRIVSEGAACRPEAPERRPARLRALAAAALAPLGLPPELLDRRASELSGGQLQRAVLARALACGARALLLDEAFSALDLPRRQQLLELLLELRRHHHLALVFVSHQEAWLRAFCGRMCEMRAGRCFSA